MTARRLSCIAPTSTSAADAVPRLTRIASGRVHRIAAAVVVRVDGLPAARLSTRATRQPGSRNREAIAGTASIRPPRVSRRSSTRPVACSAGVVWSTCASAPAVASSMRGSRT